MLPLVLMAVSGSPSFAQEVPELLTSDDLPRFEHPQADVRIRYGDGPLQFGDLHIPEGDGPHPVAVYVHGGCWLSEYGLEYSNKFASALADNGIAVWSLEYRRVGDAGGGWPGTFQDVANGADHLRTIAGQYKLDMDRIVAMGHSAGGHFAIWLAARSQIPAGVAIANHDPLDINNVLALTPAPDLANLHEQQVCGHVIDGLMGGSPEDVPDRYRWADPMQLSLAGARQTIFVGKYDDAWAPSGHRYYEHARERGDDVLLIEGQHSGHLEVIDPDNRTWELVLGATRELLNKPTTE